MSMTSVKVAGNQTVIFGNVTTNIDLEKNGKQCGYASIPLASYEKSGDDVGYGCELVPIVSIRNGHGPAVLLMAGSHGNEYEGQVLLMDLIRRAELEQVNGHLIILPAANVMAVRGDQRNSPFDEGNLNRLYPGKPGGSPSELIAHFIEEFLLPRVEYALDFHSGSATTRYLPLATAARADSPERFAKSMEIARSFGMPVTMVIDHSTGGTGALIGACTRKNVVHMSTELGGGADINKIALNLARAGLERVLDVIGVVGRSRDVPAAGKTRIVKRVPASDYVYSMSTEAGILEPLCDIGDELEPGQLCGRIHFALAPWKEPVEVRTRTGGLVLCRRIRAHIQFGDCAFVFGADWSQHAELGIRSAKL